MRGAALLMVCVVSLRAAEPDHLALAAEHLERGDAAKAISHLTVHVNANPDELMTRMHLAELLFRAKRYDDATAQFEVFIAATPESGKVREHLVTAHARLMTIAEATGDDYREHLHRGIGLLRLVERWDDGRRDEAVAETTLIKAREELKLAVSAKPNDARVQLYLALTAQRLGQREAMRSALRRMNALPTHSLSDPEKRQLSELHR